MKLARVLALLATVALMTLPSPTFADVIYGCANKRTGRIRSIALTSPKCGAAETLISWSEVGPPGPAGPGLVVKDATGALVGVVVSGDGGQGTLVLCNVGGVRVQVPVDRNGFRPLGGFPWFETSDCSGSAFLQGPPWPGSDPLTIVPAAVAGTLAFYTTAQTTTSVHLLSVLQPQTSAADCTAQGGTVNAQGICCEPVNSNVAYYPATTLDLSTLGLVPPFHVEGP